MRGAPHSTQWPLPSQERMRVEHPPPILPINDTILPRKNNLDKVLERKRDSTQTI